MRAAFIDDIRAAFPVRRLFEGGVYLRAASISGNMVTQDRSSMFMFLEQY